MFTELTALRLSVMGIDLLLAYLFFSRLADYQWAARANGPNFRSIEPMPVRWMMTMVGITLVVQALRLAPPMASLVTGSPPNYSLSSLMIGQLGQLGVIVILVLRIAYNPRHRITWMMGWACLAHIAIWAPVLWR